MRSRECVLPSGVQFLRALLVAVWPPSVVAVSEGEGPGGSTLGFSRDGRETLINFNIRNDESVEVGRNRSFRGRCAGPWDV